MEDLMHREIAQGIEKTKKRLCARESSKWRRKMLANGADPAKIVVGHMDVGTVLPMLKAGSYFEVDTFGQDFYTPWADLRTFLRFFCDAGFANRLMISIDSNWHWHDGAKIFEGGDAPVPDPNASRRTYAFMMTFVVPKLLEAGFSQAEIDMFLIENPHRFFLRGLSSCHPAEAEASWCRSSPCRNLSGALNRIRAGKVPGIASLNRDAIIES